MSIALKLYYDLLSQPSRALYIFFKKAKIPFEAVPIELRKRVYALYSYFNMYIK